MLRTLRNTVLAVGIATLCGLTAACAEDLDKAIPAAKLDEAKVGAPASETAVLAGGCFWGQQGVFEHVKA